MISLYIHHDSRARENRVRSLYNYIIYPDVFLSTLYLEYSIVTLLTVVN